MPRKRNMQAETPISSMLNLGPKSQQVMAEAGITSVEQLRKVGAVAAYSMAKRTDTKVSLNLLWALEAALTGRPWQEVARDQRTSLLLALEDHERQA